jgi:CMP-N-acetylneuraminic acid synthetase
VDRALEAFFGDPEAGSLVSVCEAEKSPYWMKSLGPDGYLREFLPGSDAYTRRQDLPKAYALNGALYVVPVASFRRDKAFVTPRTRSLVMDRRSSLDIDTLLDFEIAEYLVSRGGAA